MPEADCPPPAAREQSLADSFSVIADPHERLTAIVAACSGAGIPAAYRREQDLVPGCVSRVWVTAAAADGMLHLCWDADSPLVKGLAGLVCQVYQGTAPAAAAVHAAGILQALGLHRQLSPTRLHGLENTGRRIQALAAALT